MVASLANHYVEKIDFAFINPDPCLADEILSLIEPIPVDDCTIDGYMHILRYFIVIHAMNSDKQAFSVIQQIMLNFFAFINPSDPNKYVYYLILYMIHHVIEVRFVITILE